MDFFSAKVAYASLDSFLANTNALIINPLIRFLFALAVLYFLYGVVEFMFNQQNEEKKTTGKSHMLWGIIGITIMLGVWSILTIVLDTLDIDYINLEQGKTTGLPDYVPPSPNNLSK